MSAHKICLHYSVNDKFPNTHIEEDKDVQAQSKIKTSVSDINRHNNVGHIDFICPKQTNQVQTAYSSLLDSELTLRKMYRYCVHLVEVKQRYLRISIQNGQHIIDSRRAIQIWAPVGQEDKMIDVNDAVLCILHLELRCSENKISNLLNDGFAHRKEPKLVDDYIKRVENVVNEGKINISSHQNQWTFPLEDEGNRRFYIILQN